MSSGNGGSRALLAVRVTTLVPVVWFFLAAAIGKVAGKDWVPVEAYIWPVMIGAVVLAVVYVAYRRHIKSAAENVPDVRWLFRIAAGLFIVVNCALILYSWIVVIPAALCLVTLLDSLINRPAKEAL